MRINFFVENLANMVALDVAWKGFVKTRREIQSSMKNPLPLNVVEDMLLLEEVNLTYLEGAYYYPGVGES